MPASGLLALLDDIATIADDVATLTAAAAKKTTGIVTDDMAVTAEQAIGIRREREIPVVMSVAWGSMKNKGLILAPGALLLNAVAPFVITPILMAGGLFLCFEGVEKVLHRFLPHEEEAGADAGPHPETDPVAYEKQRVEGAIRTDLILSAEIIAISLGEISTAPFLTQVVVLYAISVIMTIGVYGMVAGLVKMDDAGELMVRRGGGSATLGNGILWAAPKILHAISTIGMVAMLMVGGGILAHGIPPLHHALEHLTAGIQPGWLSGVTAQLLNVAVGAVAGLVLVGAVATGLPHKLWKLIRRT